MARNSPIFSQVLQCLLSLFSLLGSLYHPLNHNGPHEATRPQFEGMFVFGSSVVDNGNNNYLSSGTGKANYLPYGVDFPRGPTGRFSNGKNVADIIGELLGLPPVPPFLDPTVGGQEIVRGVNFGSGGGGILDETSVMAGGAMSMNEQIKYFKEVTLPKLREQTNGMHMGLDQYLFLVGAGDNDIGLNYFMVNLANSSKPSIHVFVASLISNYASQLQTLYNSGARKFALLTAYPIGCSPATMRMFNDSKQCVPMVNSAVQNFNTKLITMVDDLIHKLPGSKFVVVNTYNIIRNIIKDPIARGFRNASSPCCELKSNKLGEIACKEGGKLCYDTNKYVYFDGHHNTEAVNDAIAAKAMFSDCSNEVYPFNLQMLAFL